MSEPIRSGEIVTLHEHVRVQLEALAAALADAERRTEIRAAEVKRDLERAEEALANRLGTMNEAREQMQRERGEFATRKEVELMIAPLRIKHEQTSGAWQVVGSLGAALLALAALAVAWLKGH